MINPRIYRVEYDAINGGAGTDIDWESSEVAYVVANGVMTSNIKSGKGQLIPWARIYAVYYESVPEPKPVVSEPVVSEPDTRYTVDDIVRIIGCYTHDMSTHVVFSDKVVYCSRDNFATSIR